MRQTKRGQPEEIFIVHHIVERKAGVGARCWEDLEESAVAAVGGIVVPTAEGIADTEPGIKNVDDGLPACFANEGSGALREKAPASVLDGAPKKDIELAVILRAKNVRVIDAVGADANVVVVGGAQRIGAIVGFENRSAFVYVTKAE